MLLVSKGLADATDDVLSNVLGKKSTMSDALNQLSQMQSKMMGMLNNAIKDHPGALPLFPCLMNLMISSKLKHVHQSNRWL